MVNLLESAIMFRRDLDNEISRHIYDLIYRNKFIHILIDGSDEFDIEGYASICISIGRLLQKHSIKCHMCKGFRFSLGEDICRRHFGNILTYEEFRRKRLHRKLRHEHNYILISIPISEGYTLEEKSVTRERLYSIDSMIGTMNNSSDESSETIYSDDSIEEIDVGATTVRKPKPKMVTINAKRLFGNYRRKTKVLTKILL